MKLRLLSIYDNSVSWTGCNLLRLFVGSTISQTLETFELSATFNTTMIDDDALAIALASCHRLKTLIVLCGNDTCVFGRNGLGGLQAMAPSRSIPDLPGAADSVPRDQLGVLPVDVMSVDCSSGRVLDFQLPLEGQTTCDCGRDLSVYWMRSVEDSAQYKVSRCRRVTTHSHNLLLFTLKKQSRRTVCLSNMSTAATVEVPARRAVAYFGPRASLVVLLLLTISAFSPPCSINRSTCTS